MGSKFLALAASGLAAICITSGSAAAQGGRGAERDLERAYEQGFAEGRRSALEEGQQLSPDRYRVLDPGLYTERYGAQLPEGHLYAEAEDETEVLIDIATDIIMRILDTRASHAPTGADFDIPRGHYPPPGDCRIWYPDRPPGQQPPPGSCDVRVPRGAVLVRG